MFVAGGIFTAAAFIICVVTFQFTLQSITIFLCICLGLG